MKAIIKRTEPSSLTHHRACQHCDYGNCADKQRLREALVVEQRGLCCYCMGSICASPDKMKIEHWKCRAKHEDQELVYRNLLGACLGGEGQLGSQQHCDTRKGDRELKWNPANPAHRIEERLEYEPDGTVRAQDPEFNEQLNEVLNLNLPLIKSNRRAAWTAALKWWQQRRRPVSRACLERKVQKLADDTGNLKPYCQVAVWLLRKKLARMVR